MKNIKRRIKEDTVLKIIEHTDSLNTTMCPIEDRDKAHKKKSLHGKFITENKFLNNTFDWLKNEGVRKELESFIFEAQEQTIPTKNYKAI